MERIIRISKGLFFMLLALFFLFETAIFSEEAYATTDDLDSAGSEQTDAMSGDCGADGSNVTWISDEDGTLTISGYGAMMSYSNRNKYWRNANGLLFKKE